MFQGLHPRIADAEQAIRRELQAIAQAEPNLSLSTLIELVSQRHSIWPIVSELVIPTHRMSGKKGGGKGVSKGQNRKGRGRSWADMEVEAKEQGETLMTPEMRRSFNSAEGCRVSLLGPPSLAHTRGSKGCYNTGLYAILFSPRVSND